jgi:AbrB family looped-hinge helix DNA binding protein
VQKEAKITSKGQVTVPQEIRRLLGARTGDRLVFEEDRNGVRVRVVKPESPFAKYRGIGNPGIPSGRAGVIRFVRHLRGA